MHWRGAALAALSLLLPAALVADDRIFSPDRPVLPSTARVTSDLRPLPSVARIDDDKHVADWMAKANMVAADVVMTLLKGYIPDQNGVEHPNPDENALDQYVHRIGDTSFRIVMQGVGNLKLIGGPYLYNELQGGLGVEYDFFRPEADGQGTLVGLRVSPAYGEVASIRLAAGSPWQDGLPTRVFLGSAFGLELSHRHGIFQPGLRAYVKELKEVNGAGGLGPSVEAALYCKIHLMTATGMTKDEGATLYLKPELTYYDRGGAKQDLYDWRPGDRLELDRTVGDIRRVWEAILFLEARY